MSIHYKIKNIALVFVPVLFFALFFITGAVNTGAHPDYIEPADRTFGSCPTWTASCHNYIEDPSGHPECSYDALSPYFGEKTWVAQEIASGESSCDPSVENGSSAGAGLFQIERSVWCNGDTYTCNGESVTLSSNISTCTSQLLNAKNNKIVACQLEKDVSMWGHWGVEGSCWGTVPEHKCNLVPAVLNKHCPYDPGGEPQADDGTCGTWSSEDGSGGGGTGGGGSGGGSTGGGTGIGTAPTLSPIVCNVDYPEIPVPGGTFDLNAYCVGGETASVGTIVQFFYAAAIWMAGIIAFVSLIVTGVMYIFSGASPSIRAAAKGRILNLLWGLVIILIASLLLFFINPDTTTLELSGLHKVDPGSSGIGSGGSSSDLPDTGTVPSGGCMPSGTRTALCSTGSECAPWCHEPKYSSLKTDPKYAEEWPAILATSCTKNINDYGFTGWVETSNANINIASNDSGFLNAVKKAGEVAQSQGYKLFLTSGHRPLFDQVRVLCWNGGRNADPASMDAVIGSTVARPGMSNHGVGIALDIELKTASGGAMSKTCDYKRTLRNILFDADPGWYRLSNEYWHFEYWPDGPPNSSRVRDYDTCG